MPKEDWYFKPWNPWRPPWSKNVETLFREAINKVAKSQWYKDDDEVERDLLVKILTQAKSWNLKAMEMYLDRLYGKPKQTVENKIEWELKINNIKELSDTELINIVDDNKRTSTKGTST